MTLYRTYRPQQFADLIGQNLVSKLLQQALIKDRIAHAYLFTGPRGTGKTSTARIFAKGICCLTPVQKKNVFEPCLTCEACQGIAHGSTTDLIEIDAASNRGIDDIRALREQAQYPPTQLKRKMYIIDECHMLSTEAFNALLKTLEEPPTHCLFILATTELHKVPLTIRSRCQIIRFEPGSTEAIAQKLDAIIADKKWKAEEGVTLAIAEFAEGGFRDAETILDQLATHHDALTLDTVLSTLGTVPSTACQELLTAALGGDIEKTRALLGEHFSESTLRYTWILSELVKLLRAKTAFGPAEIFALEKLLEATLLQRHTPVPALPLEIAALSIAAFGEQRALNHSITMAPELHRPSTQKEHKSARNTITSTDSKNTSMDKVRVTPVAAEAPQQVPVVELRHNEQPPPPTSDIRKAWRKTIEQVQRHHPPLAALVKDAIFHIAETERVVIHVRYKYHLEKLSEKKNLSLLEDTLAEIAGGRWHLVFELNQSIPNQPARAKLNSGLPNDVSSVFQTSA